MGWGDGARCPSGRVHWGSPDLRRDVIERCWDMDARNRLLVVKATSARVSVSVGRKDGQDRYTKAQVAQFLVLEAS